MPVEVRIWVAVFFYQSKYMIYMIFEVTVTVTVKTAVICAFERLRWHRWMFTQRTDDQASKLAYRKTFIVLSDC